MTFSELLAEKDIKLSPEQRAAVDADRAAIVSAGAGSGKTTVLSLRFARLVMEHKAHADEILTLTFTRKAAAEMYERIYSLLSYAAERDEYIASELSSRFPKAHISTMDSFWGEIARTDSLKYGIMRDFSIMEDDEADDIIMSVFDELSSDSSLDEAFACLSASYSEDEIRSFLSSIASEHTDILTDFTSGGNMEGYRIYSSLVSSKAIKPFLSALDELERLNDADPDSKLHDSIAGFISEYRKKGGIVPDFPLTQLRRKADKELSSFIKNTYRPLRDRVAAAEAVLSSRDYAVSVSELIERFIKRVQEVKRLHSSLAFHDAEALARAILLSNDSVRNYYASLFRYIMVDEFQDNNGGQRDLLYLLSAKPGKHYSSIPYPEDIDPSKLFFVGDDKQSIYYFRGADVSVFRSLRSDIEKMGGEYLTLSMNYRSEPALIEHFNKVFDPIFSSRDDDMEGEDILESMSGIPYASFEADFAPIDSREAVLGITPRIRMAIVPKEQEVPENPAGPDDSEAFWVASEILSMVSGSGYEVPDGNGGMRTPRFSDIALLLQTAKSQLPFERVFRLRGIPYTVVESASVAIEGLAYDLFAFLTLLVYPDDKAMYLALLRSPFARISDEGLMFLADWTDEENESFMAFSREPSFRSKNDRIAFGNLRKLYEEARDMTGRRRITEILDTIYYRSGYHSYLVSDPALAVYEEHFSYIWAAAERADEIGKSLPVFLDSLRPLIGSPDKLPEAAVQHFTSDAVHIMSIHKSKGLQFPIVIVSDAARGGSGQTERNTLSSFSGSHPFMMVDPRNQGAAHPYTMFLNMARARRERAEKKRVLYVALTRASCHLLVTASEKRGMASSLYGMYSAVSGLEEETIPIIDASELFASRHRNDSSSWYDAPVYQRGEAGQRRIAASGSADDISLDGAGMPLPAFDSDDVIREYSLYTQFGTMVHEAMEATALDREPVFPALPGIPSGVEESLRKEALSIASRFRSSDLFRKAIQGRKTESELRFYYPDGDAVVEGSADLVIFHRSFMLVIDFKTDRMMLPDVHKDQVMKYIEAIGGLYGMECYGMLLYARSMEPGPVWDREGDIRELSELLLSS